MKILLIDNSAENRDVLRLIVEKHGHTGLEAEDGQDGLKKTETHHPDLIITDVMMPMMDGFQFLRNLKRDENLRSIPCVAYSATYTGSDDRELAFITRGSGIYCKT
jgi:CheY-like chemotaxis protein